jgi:hypothetical protein
LTIKVLIVRIISDSFLSLPGSVICLDQSFVRKSFTKGGDSGRKIADIARRDGCAFAHAAV